MIACLEVCQILASFNLFWGSCYAVHINALSIIKVYIERNNMQVELIRVRKNIDFCEVRTFASHAMFTVIGHDQINNYSCQPIC